jgi:hypothetical protein
VFEIGYLEHLLSDAVTSQRTIRDDSAAKMWVLASSFRVGQYHSTVFRDCR